MKRYSVKLIGKTPLLMHALTVEWNDYIKEFLAIPGNKKKGTAGDDRYPAWKWVGYCYSDNGNMCIPADNLMSMLREGAVKCPTGKGRETFKVISQSSIMVNELSWPIYNHGKIIPIEPFENLIDNEPNFPKHAELARKHGFELFAKYVTVGKAKHVRIRPRFDDWICTGTITVLEEMISEKSLNDIFRMAGMFAGLLDWRPSSPLSPGRFGMFTHELKELKK